MNTFLILYFRTKYSFLQSFEVGSKCRPYLSPGKETSQHSADGGGHHVHIHVRVRIVKEVLVVCVHVVLKKLPLTLLKKISFFE
jgi:hypothetical protein